MPVLVQEPWSRGYSILMRLEQVLVSTRTPFQSLTIGRSEKYGLCLFLDDLMQSAESDEALYHEPFVHPALTLHPSPRRVLIAGAGEGATAREVLRHPTVESVLAVDLDGEVVDACRRVLPTWSAGAFDDSRVELRIESIEHTLARAEPSSYDVVLFDVTDPVDSGPSMGLFTTRTFEQVARVLTDDGIAVVQSGQLDLRDPTLVRAVCATLREVFAWVHPMMLNVPSFHACWSATLVAKRPMSRTPDEVARRIERLGSGLRAYTPAAHANLLTLPPFVQRLLA